MSGDIFDIDQGDKETITGTLHDPGATPGDVLTVQADGSVAAAAGGGSMPVYANYFAGGNANIAANSAGNLGTGMAAVTDLLDHTDPQNPTFIADGFYLVFVTFNAGDAGSGPMTDGAIFQAQVYLDPDSEVFDNNMVEWSTPAAAVNANSPQLTIANGGQVPAGAKLLMEVLNADSKTIAFYTDVTILKIA